MLFFAEKKLPLGSCLFELDTVLWPLYPLLLLQLMEYQNLRGGRIVFQSIKAPKVEWATHVTALEEVLGEEKAINASLLNLHTIASEHHDADLCHYLQNEFLHQQVKLINSISKKLTNAKRCGDKLGVFQFDKHGISG